MRYYTALLISVGLLLSAAILWRSGTDSGSGGSDVPADAAQAALDLTVERTLRESRTGVVIPPVEAPPVDAGQPPVEPVEPEASDVRLPDGYSFGTHRGSMQRAPLTDGSRPDPSQNPQWLDPATAFGAILDQAGSSGRANSFAVLRLLPGTDLQALNGSLLGLGASIEGVSGEYARVRVPADRGRLEAIARLPGVLGIGAVPPAIKAGTAFVQDMRARAAGELVPVYITLMSGDPSGEWREALSALDVIVGAHDPALRSYTANLPAAALARVLAADYVLSVEPVPVVTANHGSAVAVMGVDGFRDYVASTQGFTGITGSGIAVGVLDTALNTSHMDIAHGRASICGANFIRDENWDLWVDMNGHGTHVFGTVAGAGRTDPLLAGMAPGLSHLRFGKVLSAHGFGSGDDINRGMDYLSRPSSCTWQGTTPDAVKPLIVNMSLSATSLAFSGRGVGERKLDSVVHAHSQLYVVAQANSGQHGFSNYGTAKNSLAVGAAGDFGIIAGFSSHGPTADGRLAPNVVGTGVNVTSARGGASTAGHNTWDGTSMAAPSVAGVAALLMEARPEFRNRPALTRARLMASAIRPDAYFASRTQLPPHNTDGPGAFQNLYGLGLVSARTTLFSNDREGGWIIGSASARPENDSYEYIDVEVPEDARRLDVVLTWDEQPADTLTRSVLNNLDLWADRDADCDTEACGEHASRSEVDNVEWLLIEDPAPGMYRIKVVPVESYGESATAAVAWKILRAAEDAPQLAVWVEETSPADGNDEFLTVDVSIETSHFVASGASIQLSCRGGNERGDCGALRYAYLPYRSRVSREDGLSRYWPNHNTPTVSNVNPAQPIPIGEVSVEEPRRVRLTFRRDGVVPGTVLHVTATAWNAVSAAQSIELVPDEQEDAAVDPPSNDRFAGSERLSGPIGQTAADFALATREPAEPLVSAASKTLWYHWRAPVKGLFRFRLREADSGNAVAADFAVFTGSALLDLEQAAVKRGSSEISFDAQAGTAYRLRAASTFIWDQWSMEPLLLDWEHADSRPANDDLAFAQTIEGESGSLASTNEGATLERSEFLGGFAATVWYEWTAPQDGFAEFSVDTDRLRVMAFEVARIGQLRLVSRLKPDIMALFPAQEGETYRIAVAAWDADSSGAGFNLSWRYVTSDDDPNNDHFQNAGSIDAGDGATDRSVVIAENTLSTLTVEPVEPLETGIGTRWWSWTAPRDGKFTWRLDASSTFRLTVWTGDTLDNLELAASLRGGSTLVLDATGASRYRVALGASPDAIQRRYLGDSPIEISWGETPLNDDRADALALVGASGSVNAPLRFATAEAGESRSTVGENSVWWRWRASESGWRRIWVQGHPLSAILSVYPGDGSARSLGNSERSFVANGRVEVLWFARAGEYYDIRLAGRPGLDAQASAGLFWEASDPPAFLSYEGAVTNAALLPSPAPSGLRSPRNLAVSEDGRYLFSTSEARVLGFLRDTDTGYLSLAYGLTPESSEIHVSNDAHLWWNPLHERLVAADSSNRSYVLALPEDGSAIFAHQRMEFLGHPDDGYFAGHGPSAGTPDGRFFYRSDPAINLESSSPADSLLHVYRVDSPTEYTLVQRVSPTGTPDEEHLVAPNMGIPVAMMLSPDGSRFYLLTRRGLMTFSRDASTGRLTLAGKLCVTAIRIIPFSPSVRSTMSRWTRRATCSL